MNDDLTHQEWKEKYCILFLLKISTDFYLQGSFKNNTFMYWKNLIQYKLKIIITKKKQENKNDKMNKKQ